MTKSRFAFVLSASFLSAALLAARVQAQGEGCPDAATITHGTTGPLATIRYLADDLLEGRLAGSDGERCAANYIAMKFKEIGLHPGSPTNTWFQDVPLASVLNPRGPKGTGHNVIGVLDGADPLLRAEYIIVGAHYDHLGHGEFGSTAPDQKNQIHNGADDNASGVAAMLDVARRLSRLKLARSIVFVAFTAEESGLLGSAQFTSSPPFALTQVHAMLNMDMVGRLGTGPLIVYGTGTATEWKTIVDAATAAEQIEYKANPDGAGPSDHASFYAKNIPVLHFFTNVHGDYHKPSDDWDKIDAAGLDKIAAVVTRITQTLSSPMSTLTLVRAVAKQDTPPDQSRASGYGPYLGTVPDFRPVERGIAISGTNPGSPAEQAGLKSGDVIIKFDNDAVADLQGMTDLLRKHKPGDTVRITVLRDGKEVVLNATLRTRG